MKPEHKIILGDALEVLPTLKPQSVDLIFGSPPYENARTYNIDFDLKGQAWVDWMVRVVKESLRICKGLVAFVVEGKTRQFRWSATPALLMADLHRAGIHLRKPPAFHRVGIPGSGGPDWLRNDYEFIICCTNGGRLPWSDNVAMGHPPKWASGGEMSYRLSDGTRRNQWGGSIGCTNERKQNGKRPERVPRPSHEIVTKRMRGGHGKDTIQDQNYKPPKNANPGNIIKCKVGGGLMGSKYAHENEAPFPESLALFFIRSFCPPGGTVIDTFSGSGTTIAVAIKEGRKGIGIDIRGSQCVLAEKRMQEMYDNQDDNPLLKMAAETGVEIEK